MRLLYWCLDVTISTLQGEYSSNFPWMDILYLWSRVRNIQMNGTAWRTMMLSNLFFVVIPVLGPEGSQKVWAAKRLNMPFSNLPLSKNWSRNSSWFSRKKEKNLNLEQFQEVRRGITFRRDTLLLIGPALLHRSHGTYTGTEHNYRPMLLQRRRPLPTFSMDTS